MRTSLEDAMPYPLVAAAMGSLRWARRVSPHQGGSHGSIAVQSSLKPGYSFQESLSDKTEVDSSNWCALHVEECGQSEHAATCQNPRDQKAG